MKILHASNIIC